MTTPAPPPTGSAATTQAALLSQQVVEAQQAQLRQQLVTALLALWAGVAASADFSPAAAAKFVAALLPISLGAQRSIAALAVAQFNQVARPPTLIGVNPATVTGQALRGVDPTQVYARPFAEVKWRLSQGKTLGEALDAGRRRAETIALTDLELAWTHTSRQATRQYNSSPRPGRQGRIVGYRRVLSSSPTHCALCVLASTQRYHVEQLMPIHPNCTCTVGYVFEDDFRAGEHVIDPELAQQVHNVVRRDLGDRYVDAGGRLGDAHYRDIIVVNDHGELGPVLGVRGQHFERDPTRPGHLGHIRVNPADQPADVQNLDEL